MVKIFHGAGWARDKRNTELAYYAYEMYRMSDATVRTDQGRQFKIRVKSRANLLILFADAYLNKGCSYVFALLV
ncbi:hypothetical protein [Candidatus Bartonella washoeensis]|uniref:hypothetical protein n=1 Tax=Candidatus Bartonella washoeensis TaxID=186739 RepID=UPI00031FC89B|nr:hypothetical protein [Bartonella washoeensis]